MKAEISEEKISDAINAKEITSAGSLSIVVIIDEFVYLLQQLMTDLREWIHSIYF